MSMYIVNIAVRWFNLDLEGYSASGLTEQAARARALAKASDKSRFGKWTFKELTKAEYDALSSREKTELKADWDKEQL